MTHKDELKRLQSHVRELRAELEEARNKEKGYVAVIADLKATRDVPEKLLEAALEDMKAQEWMRPRLAEYMAATYRYAVRGVEQLQVLNADTAYRLND